MSWSSLWPSRRAFLSDERGVTGLVVAFTLTTMVLMLLSGIDMIRVHMIKSRTQAALDAAVLAAGHDLSANDWQQQGRTYFNANLGNGYLGSTVSKALAFSSKATASGDLVTASATVTVPLVTAAFLPLASFDIPVSNTAQRVVAGKLELALAMDNTGSMVDDGKLVQMKQAAKSLVTALFGSATTGGNVYIGLVPFTETVRAGRDSSGFVHAAWLKGGRPAHYAGAADWGGCLFERSQKGLFTLDATTPAALPFEDWAASHYDWIASWRGGSWSASQPPPAFSNCGPGGCNYVSNGGPVNGTPPRTDRNGYYGCTQTPVTFLSSDPSLLNANIDAMVANGSTMISSGMLWAWRMLSPPWRDPVIGWGSATLPKDPATTLTKAIVLLTDGNNAPSYVMPGGGWGGGSAYYMLGPYQGTPQSSSGSATNANGNILFAVPTATATAPIHVTQGGDPDSTRAADDILTSACTNARAAGITVFTIALNTDGSVSDNTRTLLSNCASLPSYYFPVTDAANLTRVFAQITSALSELKLVK